MSIRYSCRAVDHPSGRSREADRILIGRGAAGIARERGKDRQSRLVRHYESPCSNARVIRSQARAFSRSTESAGLNEAAFAVFEAPPYSDCLRVNDEVVRDQTGKNILKRAGLGFLRYETLVRHCKAAGKRSQRRGDLEKRLQTIRSPARSNLRSPEFFRRGLQKLPAGRGFFDKPLGTLRIFQPTRIDGVLNPTHRTRKSIPQKRPSSGSLICRAPLQDHIIAETYS
jgi:hypothetical protein